MVAETHDSSRCVVAEVRDSRRYMEAEDACCCSCSIHFDAQS